MAEFNSKSIVDKVKVVYDNLPSACPYPEDFYPNVEESSPTAMTTTCILSSISTLLVEGPGSSVRLLIFELMLLIVQVSALQLITMRMIISGAEEHGRGRGMNQTYM